MNRISKDELKVLREQYTKGCRVMLVQMNDPYCSSLRKGSMGTVLYVDDIGTIHILWDSGSSLGIVFNEDSCIRIDTPEDYLKE